VENLSGGYSTLFTYGFSAPSTSDYLMLYTFCRVVSEKGKVVTSSYIDCLGRVLSH
jgi:hypothetical protein